MIWILIIIICKKYERYKMYFTMSADVEQRYVKNNDEFNH